MKKSGAYPVLFMLFFISTNAQTFRCIDAESGAPVPFPRTNHKPAIYGDVQGFINFQESQLGHYKISALNYADTLVDFRALAQTTDTPTINMIYQSLDLDEALVGPQTSWLKGIVSAFERWESGWVFLKNKQLYITDNNLNLLHNAALPFVHHNKKLELFVDALDNLHILSKDSAQQLYVNESLLYAYEAVNRVKFDYLLGSLLFAKDELFVYRDNQEVDFDMDQINWETGSGFGFRVRHPPMHNCGYQILTRKKDDHKVIYSALDTVAFQEAAGQFGIYAALYINWRFENEITNNPMNKYRRAYDTARSSYQNLYAKYKHVYFISVNGKMVVLDRYQDALVYFTPKLKLISEEPFNFKSCPLDSYLYYDNITKSYWLQRRHNGFDRLESFFNTGETTYVDLGVFATNIRVHNNMVFFINGKGELEIKRIE